MKDRMGKLRAGGQAESEQIDGDQPIMIYLMTGKEL